MMSSHIIHSENSALQQGRTNKREREDPHRQINWFDRGKQSNGEA